MEKIMRMHMRKRIDDRKDQSESFFKRELPSPLLCILHQIHTLDIFHNEVCGAVFTEIVLNRHDIRHITEVGKKSCLFEELRGTGIEFRLFFRRTYCHRIMVCITKRNTGRQEFLDSYSDLERHIESQIRHAESADTENTSRKITSIQDRTDRKRDKRMLRGRKIISAVRTRSHSIMLIETTKTKFTCIHPSNRQSEIRDQGQIVTL